jgi:phospholipase A1
MKWVSWTQAMRTITPRLPGSLLLLMTCCVNASGHPLTLADCASIADATKRLACFDALAADALGKTAQTPAQRPVPGEVRPTRGESDWLARHWELDPAHRLGTFIFRPHQDNYLLIANYSSSPNEAPFSPFRGLAPEVGRLSRVELKFQLSFKIKLLQDISPQHADLWFGYTQQSNWQAYDLKASSPFRDNNYQPELMGVIPVGFQLLGMRARFVNFGLVHESNGQTLSLSRSWNRFYAQLGMENGNFALSARLWKQLGSNEDNPDIVDYMGHGDVGGTYRRNGHEFSVSARRNFRTGRGAVRAGWAFPLNTHIKGYLQAFSGYGHSLIDYNHSQTTLGIGVLITE